MERIPGETVVLVDGWNLLVRLAGAPEALADPAVREKARRRFLYLLEPWAEARGVRVVVAWDGRAPATPPPGERVRSVGVDPPAEADDWIVHEAARLHREGRPVRVVTRDRGLLDRLPRGLPALPAEELATDLLALAGPPVRAPHVRGPGAPAGELPASPDPVDPARLPRRHAPAPPADLPPAPSPADRTSPGARPATRRPPPPRPPDPREEARRRAAKERKRARWERAQRRRNARRRK